MWIGANSLNCYIGIIATYETHMKSFTYENLMQIHPYDYRMKIPSYIHKATIWFSYEGTFHIWSTYDSHMLPRLWFSYETYHDPHVKIICDEFAWQVCTLYSITDFKRIRLHNFPGHTLGYIHDFTPELSLLLSEKVLLRLWYIV